MSFFLYILLSLIEYSFYICSKQLSNRYNITLVFSNSPISKLCNLISNLTKNVIMTSKCIYFYFLSKCIATEKIDRPSRDKKIAVFRLLTLNIDL